MSNIFEVSFTEEVTVSGKDIFEGGFKLSASEARKKFYSTDSAVHKEEYLSESPSNQEYQKLKGKLNQDSIRGKSGRNCGLIGNLLGSDQGANIRSNWRSLAIVRNEQ